MSTKETTSPKKIARAAGKVYRKNMMEMARAEAARLGNIMKPKPKYVPWWLWMWGLSFFVKIKK